MMAAVITKTLEVSKYKFRLIANNEASERIIGPLENGQVVTVFGSSPGRINNEGHEPVRNLDGSIDLVPFSVELGCQTLP